jgi:copper resistance protein B
MRWVFEASLLAALSLCSIRGYAQASGADPGVGAPFGTPVADQRVYSHAQFNEFEGRFGAGNGSFRWDGEAWVGTDTNRMWLKSEGFASAGAAEDGQQELLYARPISTYFDLQAGARYDLDSAPGRGWAALGIEGLAPQFFKVSATAYVSDAGHVAAKLTGSYELMLTQQLILEPLLELDWYSKADPRRQIGSGLSELDTGLRLRYEVVRKFAPYIGVSYHKKISSTATFALANDGRADALQFALGLRMWL